MAPTLVNVAFGVLIGLALLGAAFDRRSIALVALAAALPDLDAVASLVIEGATNALLHSLWLPAAVGVVLYWDTRYRETSWLAGRYGLYGVRVAWVALAAYLVAGVGVDLFRPSGVNLLYPVHDRFYAVVGGLLLSTHDGVVQSFLVFETAPIPLSSPGTTADHHVATWVNPTPGTGIDRGVEREVRFVETGWQLVVVAAAAVAVAVRLREEGE